MAPKPALRYSSNVEVSVWLASLADLLKHAAASGDVSLPHDTAERIGVEALAMAEYLRNE